MASSRFSTLVLLEASQNYEAMFTSLQDRIEKMTDAEKKHLPDHGVYDPANYIAQKIAWARRTFKKQDRIVWYLRFLKAFVQHAILGDAEYSVKGQSVDWAEVSYVVTSHRFRDQMEHFFSLDYVKIQDYTFGTKTELEIRSDLAKLEREYVEKVNAKINSDDSSLEGTTTLIDCGDNWFWISLNRAACEREGKAMGHCGNSPRSESDENILSLRKLKKRDNGSSYWEPHLTFTINEGGELLEMKGRGNAKPVERYHGMIAKLLLFKRGGEYLVHEIRGGEWLPENDFALDDLAADLKDSILQKRPELGDLFQYVEYGGDLQDGVLPMKLRQYCFNTPLIPNRSPAWYDWSLVDGKLQYNLATHYGSMLSVLLLGQWANSIFGNRFTALSDDPVMDITFLMTPEEAENFEAGYQRNLAKIEAWRRKKREEVTSFFRKEVNQILKDGGDLGYVNWGTSTERVRNSIPITIRDTKVFVSALPNRMAEPMRGFVNALRNISSPRRPMSERAKKYDNEIYHEFMALVQE